MCNHKLCENVKTSWDWTRGKKFRPKLNPPGKPNAMINVCNLLENPFNGILEFCKVSKVIRKNRKFMLGIYSSLPSLARKVGYFCPLVLLKFHFLSWIFIDIFLLKGKKNVKFWHSTRLVEACKTFHKALGTFLFLKPMPNRIKLNSDHLVKFTRNLKASNRWLSVWSILLTDSCTPLPLESKKLDYL